MPPNDGVRLHEVDGVTPVGKHALHQDPELAIAVLDLWASHRSLQHRELVSQRGILEDELLAARKDFDRDKGGLLGNVLVDLATISWDDVAHALREQGQVSATG